MGPIDDGDWDSLMRDWRSVDMHDGDNAAAFLAMLLSVRVGAATAANIGDVYDSASVGARPNGLIKTMAEFSGQIMEAACIVVKRTPEFLEEQERRMKERRKEQQFIEKAGTDHGSVTEPVPDLMAALEASQRRAATESVERRRAEMGEEAWLELTRERVRKTRESRGMDLERAYNRAYKRALSRLAKEYPDEFEDYLTEELESERADTT